MTPIPLSFTTKLKEPKPFLVDGIEYHMLGMDHLNADDESEVVALFARYIYKARELDLTPNAVKGKVLADAMKATRLAILVKMTDMPKAVAEKMLLTQQVTLLEALQAEVDGEDEDGDALPDEDTGDGAGA